MLSPFFLLRAHCSLRLACRLIGFNNGEEPAALTLYGVMISHLPRSQSLRKSNTPPAPLRQCSKWLPSFLTCGILLYRRLPLIVLAPSAPALIHQPHPELSGTFLPCKTADFSETAVSLLVIRVRGTHLVASDLNLTDGVLESPMLIHDWA